MQKFRNVKSGAAHILNKAFGTVPACNFQLVETPETFGRTYAASCNKSYFIGLFYINKVYNFAYSSYSFYTFTIHCRRVGTYFQQEVVVDILIGNSV